MSFLSVLSKIGKVFTTTLDAIRPVEPIIAAIPGIGTPFDTAFTIASDLERLIPGSGQGATKLSALTGVMTTVHPGIDTTAMQAQVSKMIQGLNMLQEAEAALNALQPAAKTP